MTSLFSVSIKGGEVREIVRGGTNGNVHVTPDGRLIYLHQSNAEPNEAWAVNADGDDPMKLTAFNDELLDRIEMGRFADWWFTGAEGRRVQMINLSAAMGGQFAFAAAEITAEIKQLGPSPLKEIRD